MKRTKTKICRICKRRIRVAVMNYEQGFENTAEGADIEVTKSITYSFYNHRNGLKLCRGSHKKFTVQKR